MKSKILYIPFFILITIRSFAQTGGDNVYEFINLTHSALISSMGGSNVSLVNRNLNLSWHNPALLDSGMNNNLAFNYVNYFAGINYGLALYSGTLKGKGTVAGGIMYLDYGNFTEADEAGNITGSFRASESSLTLIFSRQLDSMFSVGVNLKPILSHLERYNSFGLAVDLGASWHNRSNSLSAGFVLRNIGYQITRYSNESRGRLPFEVMAGVSAQLAHAPLRYSITIRHLEKYDLTHNYVNSENVSALSDSEFIENLLRHVIFGMEIIPFRNLYLSLGYNHQRRSELQTEPKVASTGFSWGFGINTSAIDIEFGRASYHLAGASNHISLIIRPAVMYKKSITRNIPLKAIEKND